MPKKIITKETLANNVTPVAGTAYIDPNPEEKKVESMVNVDPHTDPNYPVESDKNKLTKAEEFTTQPVPGLDLVNKPNEKIARKEAYVKKKGLKPLVEIADQDLDEMLNHYTEQYNFFVESSNSNNEQNEDLENTNLLPKNSKKEFVAPITEAVSGNKKLRNEIENMILTTIKYLDKNLKNHSKYRQMFVQMNDKKFFDWAKKFKEDPNKFIYLEFQPYEEPTLMDIKKAANYLKVPLEEEVYLPHLTGDKENPIKVKNKIAVGYLYIKKVQQILSKKNTGTIDISKRSMKTGSLTMDSKVARITEPELYGLAVMGAKYAIREFFGPKGDDMAAKESMYRQISQEGYTKLADLSFNIDEKQTVNTLDMYFLGLGLKTDLITPGLILRKTILDKD